MQGWEFAHQFSKKTSKGAIVRFAPIFSESHFRSLNRSQSLFCYERPEWVTWANCSGCSFVKSNRSKSLKSHFIKGVMGEERREWCALLGIKRGKTVKNIPKIRIFRANHSHCSILKRNESPRLLFCKELHERIAHGRSIVRAILSKRAKSKRENYQPCVIVGWESKRTYFCLL